MAKYRKKPVVIEAGVYEFGMEDGFIWGHNYMPADGGKFPEEFRSEKYPRYHECYEVIFDSILSGKAPEWRPYIDTLEGKHIITEGDYIITGVENERYPCKPSVFAKTYEPAEEANNNSLDEIINICKKLLPFVDDGLSVHIEKIWELAKDAKE